MFVTRSSAFISSILDSDGGIVWELGLVPMVAFRVVMLCLDPKGGEKFFTRKMMCFEVKISSRPPNVAKKFFLQQNTVFRC